MAAKYSPGKAVKALRATGSIVSQEDASHSSLLNSPFTSRHQWFKLTH